MEADGFQGLSEKSEGVGSGLGEVGKSERLEIASVGHGLPAGISYYFCI